MMSLPPPSDHFKGKSVIEHLAEARTKGASASREVHGTEMSGHIAAGADASRETAIALALLGGILLVSGVVLSSVVITLLLFSFGWLVWKTGRSALLGWSRLERLHRLIEEERFEILHNREQEKEELRELYEAKGFKGKILDQAVEILMADDNRLLKVMLEEELGLTLESYEHPLKQAFGAAVGTLIASVFIIFCLHLIGLCGLLVGAAVILIASTIFTAKIEHNRLLNGLLWTIATVLFSGGLTYLAYVLTL